MSVRECPREDPCSWSHSDYYRKAHVWWDRLNCGSNAFLKFTHTLCTLPFDEEDRAYQIKPYRHTPINSLIMTTRSTHPRPQPPTPLPPTRNRTSRNNLPHPPQTLLPRPSPPQSKLAARRPRRNHLPLLPPRPPPRPSRAIPPNVPANLHRNAGLAVHKQHLRLPRGPHPRPLPLQMPLRFATQTDH